MPSIAQVSEGLKYFYLTVDGCTCIILLIMEKEFNCVMRKIKSDLICMKATYDGHFVSI